MAQGLYTTLLLRRLIPQKLCAGPATKIGVQNRQILEGKGSGRNRDYRGVDLSSGSDIIRRVPNETYLRPSAERVFGPIHGIAEYLAAEFISISKAAESKKLAQPRS